MPPKKKVSETRGDSGPRLRCHSAKPGPKKPDFLGSKIKTTKKNLNRLTANLPRFILPEYVVNTRVLCQHTDSFYYDAKIIAKEKDEFGGNVYTIHYNVCFIIVIKSYNNFVGLEFTV